MKEIERLNYTAGYLDGDGCFYIGKTIQKQNEITVYEFSIQVVSVRKAPLDMFREFFGGFIRTKPYKKRHKTANCWTIKGQKSAKCAEKIEPFLKDKRVECEFFIEFSQLINFNKFKTVNQDILQRRNDLIFKIRQERHMNNLIRKEDIEKLKEIKLTVTPSEIDFPYLAGLIDSEGCFRIKKWKPKNKPNYVHNITVEIGNTKFTVLPWLMERFGGSVVFIPAKGTKRDSATWTLSAAALYKILPKIRPFLIAKGEVCDSLIEFQKTILSNGGDRHSELFRALFEKRQEIRERIVREVHEFNRKGSH